MHNKDLPNLDAAERDKFDAVAASWWDPAGSFRPLHDLNPARLRYIAQRCDLSSARVLDVGCGGGILSEALASKGARVTGVDIAPKVLQIARMHLLESGLEVDYQLSTVESLAASQPDRFDVITCMELLEHVPDPTSTISAMAALLKPGGHLFLSTLNRTPMAWLFGIVGAEYVARILPRGTHRYDRFIRPSELGSWLRQAGLSVEDFTGLHYNPLAGSVRLGGAVQVNYLAHAHRPSA